MISNSAGPPDARAGTLEETIDALIVELPEGGVTLAEIRDLVGPDGLLVLCAFLTLVFLVPVSIPGVSTVFGAGILLIGISRFFGRTLWLPTRLADRSLEAGKLKAALHKGSAWLHRLEKISRLHRMERLVKGRAVRLLNDGALILGAGLLMAPFGFVPFSNTLPALALLFLAIGLLQHDGLFVIYGHLMNVATMIYFAVLILGGGAALRELLQRIVG